MRTCADCNGNLKEEKVKRELKVTFNNPGTVFVDAEVYECENCQSTFSEGDDTDEIFARIEEKYKAMHERKA